jgi:hypothetical protein
MTTAFQANAFQNNAFQIDDEATGNFGGIWWRRRRKHEPSCETPKEELYEVILKDARKREGIQQIIIEDDIIIILL